MNASAEPTVSYWADLDRRMKISAYYDRQAGRLTNAAFELLNAVPFGSLRVAS